MEKSEKIKELKDEYQEIQQYQAEIEEKMRLASLERYRELYKFPCPECKQVIQLSSDRYQVLDCVECGCNFSVNVDLPKLPVIRRNAPVMSGDMTNPRFPSLDEKYPNIVPKPEIRLARIEGFNFENWPREKCSLTQINKRIELCFRDWNAARENIIKGRTLERVVMDQQVLIKTLFDALNEKFKNEKDQKKRSKDGMFR